MGQIGRAAFQLVDSPAEDHLAGERIIIKTLAKRGTESLEIPARADHRNLIGVGRCQGGRHLRDQNRGGPAVERARHPSRKIAEIIGSGRCIGGLIADDHRWSEAVKYQLGRGPAEHAGQAGALRVVLLVFAARIGEGFAALEHRIIVSPIRVIAHGLGQRVRRFQEPRQRHRARRMFRQPGDRGAVALAVNPRIIGVIPEARCQRIPEAIEELAAARHHPWRVVFVVPEGAHIRLAGSRQDVATHVSGHGRTRRHQLERIRLGHQRAGKTDIGEGIGRVRRLGHWRTGGIHRLVGRRIERRKRRGASAGGHHLVGTHFRQTGREVGVLRQHPGVRGVSPGRNPVGPVERILQGEHRALTDGERRVASPGGLVGGGYQRVLFIRIVAGQIGVRLLIDRQIAVEFGIKHPLLGTRLADSFAAELAGNVDLAGGLGRGIVHRIVVGQEVWPGRIRVQGAVRIRGQGAAYQTRVFVIADLQAAVIRGEQAGPVHRIDGAPGAHGGQRPVVDAGIVVGDRIDDRASAEAGLVESAIAGAGDPRCHRGGGGPLIGAVVQRLVHGVGHDHAHRYPLCGEVAGGDGLCCVVPAAVGIDQHRTQPPFGFGEILGGVVDGGGFPLGERHAQEVPVVAGIAVKGRRKRLVGIGRNQIVVMRRRGGWKIAAGAGKKDSVRIIRGGADAGAVRIFPVRQRLGDVREIRGDLDGVDIAVGVRPRQGVNPGLQGIPFLADIIPLPRVSLAASRLRVNCRIRFEHGTRAGHRHRQRRAVSR